MSRQNESVDLKGLESAAPEASPKVQTPPAMLNPEAQAYANGLVTEAIRSLFKEMAPILQGSALTPEKFASALSEAEKLRRAPDPAVVARELRERQLMRVEQEENARNKKAVQESCPHAYPSGAATWHVIRNFPDRQPRFICALCFLDVAPRQWVIGPPTPEEPRGHAYIQEAHPLYKDALKVLATKGV